MKVDFFNFKYVPKEVSDRWRNALENGIKEGVFIGGLAVRKFEEEFALAVGTKYAIGVSNGYDGLEIALRVLGIGLGKKVALPAHTFIATWNAVIAVGATPVGIDVGNDGQIDIVNLEEALERERIDCVIPVHMHGHASDIKSIKELCDKRGIRLIEDASQAHLADQDGISVGTSGDIGVFSLYPTKNLGALGDAGVLVTSDILIAQKARELSNYGSTEQSKYFHSQLGFNRRLDSLQALVLSENLIFLKEWNSLRKQKADMYVKTMQELGIEFINGKTGSVWHHFCVFTPRRRELQGYLLKSGIGTEIHYPVLAAHEAEQFIGREKGFYPVAERIANTILSLPLSQFHSDTMVEFVCETIQMAVVNENLFS